MTGNKINILESLEYAENRQKTYKERINQMNERLKKTGM